MIIDNKYSNGLTSGLIFILAITCGGIVANLYYAQILVVPIGHSLNLNFQLVGLIVTVTQLGYGVGLLFIVPLSDIIENKRLIIGLLIIICLCLFSLVFSHISTVFLICSFFLGISCVAAQIIIPFVAHFTPIEKRGKVIGNVMSGLLLGIMLARPLSGWVTGMLNWQSIFVFSALLILLIAILLYWLLPARMPQHKISYKQLIYSLPSILKSYPILQRRALYHAILFGIFSLFWTSVAMILRGEYYHYSETQVAIFAFVGAIGALVAPIAGRIADRGWTRVGTGVAIVFVGIACILANWNNGHSIILLILAALFLDAGVSCNLVLGQRAIFALAPEVRGRLNGLYMAIFFTGGAIGSGLSGYLYAHGGWSCITNVGTVASVATFIYFISEYFTVNYKHN